MAIDISRRLASVGESATIAITAAAKQMQADGIDVVGFGAGEPDFDTPQFIKDAAKAALDDGDTKYTPRTAGKLRQAIADKMARDNGLHYSAAQVQVTFGGKQALYDVFQVLLDPGDKVLIPAPYWVSYPEMVKLAGGTPVVLETSIDGGFKITPRQLLDAAGGTKVLVLNSPSNPTGAAYTPDELAALGEAVLQTDLIVLADECYEKLMFGGAKFVSFASLDDRLPERTITLNSFSKTFAMTGWRLGWVAGPDNVIAGVRRLMSHETTNPVSFAQAAALAACTDPRGDEAAEKMRAQFETRCEHMTERLNAIAGIRCLAPAGALYCFPDVSEHYGRTIAGVEVTGSRSFARAALEAVKVAMVPGEAFGEDRCVRLCFATSMAQIDEGLDRIERLLGG